MSGPGPGRLRLRVFAPFRGTPSPDAAAAIADAVAAERARAAARGEAVGDPDSLPSEWATTVFASESGAGVLLATDVRSCWRAHLLNEAVRRGWSEERMAVAGAELREALSQSLAADPSGDRAVYHAIVALKANRGNAQAVVEGLREGVLGPTGTPP